MPTITFTRIGPHRNVLPLRTEATGPGQLTEAVHHYARAMLGSRSVGITLDGDTGRINLGSATVGEFTVNTQEQQPDAPPDRHPDPMHGWSLNELSKLTNTVLKRDRWHTAGDVEERRDAVWFALVQHILQANAAPTGQDLFWVGINASDKLVTADMRTHGRSTHAYGEAMPRYAMFWNPVLPQSPERGVVERNALHQIWPQLTLRQQQALTALAATGDYRQAAASLGVTQGTFHVLISKARQRYLLWWHEGEKPSRVWGTDRRIGVRSATEPAKSKRRPATGAVLRRSGRPERELVHGKASTYANHACRCTPCTDAASKQARERNQANGAKPRARITESQLAAIRLRKAAGESVKAMAMEHGVADTYVYRLLNGTRQPVRDAA
jgi:predicted DNA-binding protein (UPF0251 family)